MTNIINTGSEIVCPRANENDKPIIIDLKEASKIESRIYEIQCLTPAKAPELLGAFTIGWKQLHESIILLVYEKNRAEKRADAIRGRIMLDELQGILERKKLTSAKSPNGSEDMRSAVLATNEEYQTALEKVDHISAITELLKGKARAIQMAYDSVKKIMGGTQNSSLYTPELMGTTGETESGANEDVYPGFGKTAY